MKRAIVIALLTLAAGLVYWFFGLEFGYAVIVSLAVLAGSVLWISLPSRPLPPSWPPGPALTFDGTRRETAQLAWSLRSRGIVGEGVVERVRRLARNRIAALRLDVLNPAHRPEILRLVGPDVYELVAPGSTRPATLGTVLRALDALERLPSVSPHRSITHPTK
jgi:hypothetical protein